jgi:hypothetical protein
MENQQDRSSGMSRPSDYIRAEVSKAIGGPVDSDELSRRKEACLACPDRVESMNGSIDPGNIGFCSACKCGGSRRAALSVKLTMPAAKCPKNKWHQTSGIGGTAETAAQAIRGVGMTIADQVRLLLGGNDRRSPPV